MKNQALTLFSQKAMTHREICETLGVSRSTLTVWIRQAKLDNGDIPATDNEMTTREKQQASEIRRLRQEVEILKKATAYCAGSLAPK